MFDSRNYIASAVWTGRVELGQSIALTGVNTRVVYQIQPHDTSYGIVFSLKQYVVPTITLSYSGGYPTITLGNEQIQGFPPYSFHLQVFSLGVSI